MAHSEVVEDCDGGELTNQPFESQVSIGLIYTQRQKGIILEFCPGDIEPLSDFKCIL